MRLNAESDESHDYGGEGYTPPPDACHAAGSIPESVFGFVRNPKCAMFGEREVRSQSNQDGVPIENAGVRSEAEVRPQSFKEVAGGVERNAADDITEGDSAENRQQHTGTAENEIPKRRPKRIFEVTTKFDRDAAQNQQPQNHGKGEIEAAEAGSVENRKRKKECAARGNQPDFVCIANRPNASDYRTAFGIRSGDS